jgi:hypothetical protein
MARTSILLPFRLDVDSVDLDQLFAGSTQELHEADFAFFTTT